MCDAVAVVVVDDDGDGDRYYFPHVLGNGKIFFLSTTSNLVYLVLLQNKHQKYQVRLTMLYLTMIYLELHAVRLIHYGYRGRK